MKSDDFVICPHCGESVRRDALACRHCGSDDSTGWSHATDYDGVDLPEEGAYEEGLEREGFRKPESGGRKWHLAGISTILVFLFAVWLFKGLWQG